MLTSEEDFFIGVLAGIIVGLSLLFIKLGLPMNL
jgi:tetrahydromethanopterin S-methyltransferase subunit G